MDTQPTASRVDFVISDNETFSDAVQFDPPPFGLTGASGCTGPQWNLTGMSFRMDLKRSPLDENPLISFTSAAGQIVVDDVAKRIIHFNVPEATLNAALIPGRYIYDFVMFDGSTPPIRTVLMQGEFRFRIGITGG